jgi:hypothetical protein
MLPFCIIDAQLNLRVDFLISLYLTRQSSLLAKRESYRLLITDVESTEDIQQGKFELF